MQLEVAVALEDADVEVGVAVLVGGGVEGTAEVRQLHALEILEGRFEHAVAYAGKPVVHVAEVGV